MAQSPARRIYWFPATTATSAERITAAAAVAPVRRPAALEHRPAYGRSGKRSSPAAVALRARSRIDQLYHVRVSLASLASDLGVSREHLCRSFRGHFRLTVTDYIRGRRIEAALTLIDGPDVQLKNVGFAVGYTSYNEFFRAFKRVVQMTPTAYVNHLRLQARSGT